MAKEMAGAMTAVEMKANVGSVCDVSEENWQCRQERSRKIEIQDVQIPLYSYQTEHHVETAETCKAAW